MNEDKELKEKELKETFIDSFSMVSDAVKNGEIILKQEESDESRSHK